MAKTEKDIKKNTEAAKAAGQSVQKASPARPLNPFEEMDRMFESFFPRWWHPMRLEWPSTLGELKLPFEGHVPKVDVIDRENEVLVKAEIPGVEKKDLDISLTESTVTIKGSTRREEKEEKGDYYRAEISRGAFTRTVNLPCEVDTNKAKAVFNNGILELSLPKVKTSKRRTLKVE